MIRFFLLLLIPISIFASKILSYNIYDRSDRVDVMFTFDTPYTGVIKQGIGDSTIAIKLQDAEIESSKLKKVNSKYLKSLSITPMSDYTKIVAQVPQTVELKASKTADAYGLRLRFTTKTIEKKESSTTEGSTSPFSNLPTKKDDDISQSYYIVISILIFGIIVLFYIKKRVTPINTSQQNNSSWLFKDTNKNENSSIQNSSIQNSDVTIRFQKSLDNENSVVMLDFAEQSYLVLMGRNNLLLDRFLDNKPQTQDEFDTILQERHKELDNFLRNDQVNEELSESKEALQAYKERAAAIKYEN